MHVRPFHPDDTEAVVSLWRACKLITSHNDPYRDIARKLRVNPDLFLVGELDGNIMASVMGGYEGHRGWLNYLAVSPGHQHQGCGRILVETVERLLAERGAPKINLQVRTTNRTVIEVYQALGYSVDDVISLGKRLIQD